MLMQLPTPLLCIMRTPRAPHVGIGQRPVDQDAMPGIGHVGELGDVVLAQQIIHLILPAHGGVGFGPGTHRRLSSCFQSRFLFAV
jgi:hypothetical protein